MRKCSAVCCCILFLCFGCAKKGAPKIGFVETNDRNFVRATKYIRSGMYDDAIKCLHRIARNHPKTPESNLLLGTIYLDRKKDYISAIYFFRNYLDQCKNKEQTKIAEQLIDTAKKEFLKSLPAYNGVSQSEAELLEISKILKQENIALRSQLSEYSSKIAVCESKINALINALSNNPKAIAASQSAEHSEIVIHTVSPGDTLSSISEKYYGTQNSWKKILEANKSTIPSPKALSIGQNLVIP